MNGSPIPYMSVKLSNVVVDSDLNLNGHKITGGSYVQDLPNLTAYKSGPTLTLLSDATERPLTALAEYPDYNNYRDNTELVIAYPATVKRGSVVHVSMDMQRSSAIGAVYLRELKSFSHNTYAPQSGILATSILTTDYQAIEFDLTLHQNPVRLFWYGYSTGVDSMGVLVKNLLIKADSDTPGAGVWEVLW